MQTFIIGLIADYKQVNLCFFQPLFHWYLGLVWRPFHVNSKIISRKRTVFGLVLLLHNEFVMRLVVLAQSLRLFKILSYLV